MPEISDSFVASFRERLRGLGIETVVIGAIAAARYRVTSRETTDIDLLARTLDGLSDAMRAEGNTVHEMADPGGRPYLTLIKAGQVSIDVLLAETEYQMLAMDRAVDGFLSIEDVIIHKLLAWRPRDRDDISSILAAGHELDEQYIEEWTKAWQVEERWIEAKAASA